MDRPKNWRQGVGRRSKLQRKTERYLSRCERTTSVRVTVGHSKRCADRAGDSGRLGLHPDACWTSAARQQASENPVSRARRSLKPRRFRVVRLNNCNGSSLFERHSKAGKVECCGRHVDRIFCVNAVSSSAPSHSFIDDQLPLQQAASNTNSKRNRVLDCLLRVRGKRHIPTIEGIPIIQDAGGNA